MDAAENSAKLFRNQETRCRVSALHLAFVGDKEVAKGRATWPNPDLKGRRDSTHASAAGGVGAAISAWISEERSRVSGQELTEEGEPPYGGLTNAAKARSLNDWKQVKAFQPFKVGTPSKSIVGTR